MSSSNSLNLRVSLVGTQAWLNLKDAPWSQRKLAWIRFNRISVLPCLELMCFRPDKSPFQSHAFRPRQAERQAEDIYTWTPTINYTRAHLSRWVCLRVSCRAVAPLFSYWHPLDGDNGFKVSDQNAGNFIWKCEWWELVSVWVGDYSTPHTTLPLRLGLLQNRPTPV